MTLDRAWVPNLSCDSGCHHQRYVIGLFKSCDTRIWRGIRTPFCSDCRLVFATRENLFSLLAMAGSPKENGTIVVIFEGNFPKIKVLIWFFCVSLRTFRRCCWREDNQWGIQNLEKEYTVFVRFSNDSCLGMA